MNSNVRAVLVVWLGKAAVGSLVDRLSEGGKPKFYHFSSWKFLNFFFGHKKLKKPPSKVAHKNSTPLFSFTASTAQMAQTEEFMFQNVA